ncbi:MAG: hypothetical protein LH606_17775 [Cytophagaceae bacterium]|nr:hypothetical protein [Cytophagaceae bacterium]
MKSQKVAVALLSVLMTATFANKEVLANDEPKDSVAKISTNSQMITRGAQVGFARFVQKSAPQLIADATLGNFLNVVNQYDNAPARLLKADVQSQANFKASVLKLNERLVNVKGVEATAWLERVNRTANTITFLWSYQAIDQVPVAIEYEVVTEKEGQVINL